MDRLSSVMLRLSLLWLRLATIQIWLLAGAVTTSALAWTWRIERGGAAPVIALAQAGVAFGYILFGAIVFGTLSIRSTRTTISQLPLIASGARPPRSARPAG
jgi:hypothetical protein